MIIVFRVRSPRGLSGTKTDARAQTASSLAKLAAARSMTLSNSSRSTLQTDPGLRIRGCRAANWAAYSTNQPETGTCSPSRGHAC